MKPKTILIVDSDAALRSIVYNKLSIAGYEVLTAADGYEGMEIISDQAHNLDLILLDISLPKMSGEALIRFVHDNPLTRHLPVLLCTEASSAAITSGLKAGALDFIMKPFKTSELLMRIQVLLDYYQHKQAVFSEQYTTLLVSN